MTKKSYRWDGELNKLIEVDKGHWRETPFVQSDQLEKPLKHVVSGRWFDSKSEYRKETKRLGCVEVGNDLLNAPEPKRDFKLDRSKIERAYYLAKQRLLYNN